MWIRAGPGPGTTATPAWGSAAPSERARWNAHVRQVACPAGLGSGSSGREESGVDSRPLVGVDPFGRDDLRYSVVTELDSPAVGGRVAAGFDDAVVVVADEHQVAERVFSAPHQGTQWCA